MKIKIEIELGGEVQSGPDVAQVILREFASFADGKEPLQLNERGPFFDRTTGTDIGKWEVVR